MKSCVVIFFLVSLISSDTAAPPPGIKVRITEKVKDLGLMYLKGLVNREFLIENEDFLIKSVTLTKLQIDPAQVDFRFQDKIGLQFEIRDLNFALQLQREKNVQFFKKFKIDKGTTIFTGEGVRAMILVRMNQNPKGHLNVEIGKEDCKINADSIRTKSTGFVGKVLDKFKSLTKHFFKKKICPALQPMINDKLKDLSTMRTVHEGRQLDLDYSLSSDIAVTSRSLDMSFKGLLSVHGKAVDPGSIRPGREPVFTETNKMVYVGISEFFFNGAAMAIYKSGPFEFNVPEMEGLLVGLGQKIMEIKPGPWTAELIEAPIIEISNDDLSATAYFKAQRKAKLNGFLMTCRFKMDIEFKERLLIMNIQEPKCKEKAGKIKGKFLVRRQCSNRFTSISLYQQIFIIIIIIIIITCVSLFVQAFLVNVFHERITKSLVKEIPIPLPAELSLINATNQFEEGYLVVGGSLTFNPQNSSNAGG
uniref:Bactericidal permeability-increasing protein n=1 Tax=Oreochromis niloticus TaxID=8128 RepID=A0A669E0Q8_ORENI